MQGKERKGIGDKGAAGVLPFHITDLEVYKDIVASLLAKQVDDFDHLIQGLLSMDKTGEVLFGKVIPAVLKNPHLQSQVGGSTNLEILIDVMKEVIRHRYVEKTPPSIAIERTRQNIARKYFNSDYATLLQQLKNELGISKAEETEYFFTQLLDDIERRASQLPPTEQEKVFQEFKNKIEVFLIYAVGNRISKEIATLDVSKLYSEEYIREKKSQLLNIANMLLITEKPSHIEPPPTFERKMDFYRDLVSSFADVAKYKIIRTGFCNLDGIFSTKGFVSREVYFIAGRYGIGKSTFTTALAVNMAKFKGQRVFYITLELPKEMIQIIKDSYLYGLSRWELNSKLQRINELRRRALENPRPDDAKRIEIEINRILKQLEQQLRPKYESSTEIRNAESQFLVMELPRWGSTPSLIASHIEKIVNTEGISPDVIVIDHFDILDLEPHLKTGNFMDNETAKLKQLMELANRYNAVVIVVSQLKMEGIKKANTKEKKSQADIVIKGEDVAGSRVREEASAGVFTLNSTDFDEEKNFIKMYVDKNRYGLQKLTLLFEFKKDPVEITPVVNPKLVAEKGYSGFTLKSTEYLADELKTKLNTPEDRIIYAECLRELETENLDGGLPSLDTTVNELANQMETDDEIDDILGGEEEKPKKINEDDFLV